MEKLELYERVRVVPEEAKKEIKAGRIKGMTDINPMWRIKKLTEEFGPCGIGWYYKPIKKWAETIGDETCVFADIELYIRDGEQWSMPICGTGGSKLSTKERSGVYVSDECYKMATTDALSVACKQLGIGADVYFSSDRTKYDKPDDAVRKTENNPTSKPDERSANKPVTRPANKGETIGAVDISVLRDYFADNGISEEKILKKYAYKSLKEMPQRIFTNITNPSNLNYFQQKCGV